MPRTATYDDIGLTYDSEPFGYPEWSYDGTDLHVEPGDLDSGTVINPPFNDPFKDKHKKRYKWKHGLLGRSYLER